MSTTSMTDAVSASPWMNDYATAQELRGLAARGVKIQTADEYFDGQPGPHGGEFLQLSFSSDADVEVWYDDTRGWWRLEVDTMDRRPDDVAAEVARAATIAEAARVCRDFNNR